MSITEIKFFNTAMFKVDMKLQAKMYLKPTNRQSYLYSKPENPNSTKKGNAYNRH